MTPAAYHSLPHTGRYAHQDGTLSPKRKAILRLIVDLITANHGRPPGLRELGREAGITINAVRCHLLSLHKHGWIIHTPSHHAIRVVGLRIEVSCENTTEGRRLAAALEEKNDEPRGGGGGVTRERCHSPRRL